MKKILSVLTVFAFAAATAAHAVALNPIPPLKPLYSAYSSSLNDNIYTTDSGLIYILTTYGGQYVDTGVVGYVEAKEQPNTLPFKRYWKDIPQTDNFYTTDPAESQSVLANGWGYVGIEGYLYTWQVPGSIPLYRANKFNATTADQVHKYTTSFLEIQQLQAQGWRYDRVAGYLYANATPTVSGGWIFGRRCPTGTNCQGPNFRDYHMPFLKVAATSKPSGRTKQRITFNFWSPDFFQAERGHFSVGIHGRVGFSPQNVDRPCLPGQEDSGTCTYHRGAGLIVVGSGACGVCGKSRNVGTEVFWVQGNMVEPPAFHSGTMSNNVEYSLYLVVSDSGAESYTIKNAAGVVMASSVLETAGLFPPTSPFPSELTGYWIAHANDSIHDFTLYVTNISVSWLP